MRVLLVVLLLVVASSGCKPKVDARARELPALTRAGQGVESRFWLREISVAKQRSAPSTLLIAVDDQSGGHITLDGIELPQGAPNAEGIRAALLRGELLAVGAPQSRASVDRTEGRATAGDAGVSDLVLYVRETVATPTSGPKDGPPLVIAARSCSGYDQDLTKILVDDTHAYFSSCGGLHRVPKNGGKVETIRPDVSDFVLDAASVYWSASALVRTPKAGGADVILVPDGSGRGLTGDATHLYWYRNVFLSDATEIVRVAKEGGPVSVLATTNEFVDGIALDDGHVYVTTSTRKDRDQSINVIPKNGGTLVAIASSRTTSGQERVMVNPAALTSSGDRVVWLNWCGGCAITSAPKDGKGPITSHSATKGAVVDSLTIAGDDLYYTTGDHAFRVATNGPATQFPEIPPVTSRVKSTIAVDATQVYRMMRISPDPRRVDALVRQAR